MKVSKKVLIPILAVVVLAGSAFTAKQVFARGCPMMGGMFNSSDITDAQRTKAQSIMQASQDKMDSLQEKLFVKEQELEALQNATNPDVNAVSKAATEVTQLHAQVQKEREACATQMEKALDMEAGTLSSVAMGRSMGRGYGIGRGMGRGDGMGRGRGHGRGHGWHW